MDSTTTMYVLQALNGLSYGMFLFLVASGLTLIFGMMGILNIAHASFFMLSAYFCYTFAQLSGNFWVALVCAPIVIAVFGVLCERFIIRNAHAFGHVSELLVTLALSLVILQVVKIFWGTDSLYVAPPAPLDMYIPIGDMRYPVYRLFVIGFALVILGFMAVILYKTRLGMIVRAAKSNPEMVSVLGINVPVVFMLVFGIGSWLAGIAGVIISPLLTVFPGMADQVGLDAFVVVVTGGLGSLVGAFVASILLGVINSFGIQFMPRIAPLLMFIFMAVVLAFKPSGLFGGKEQ